ncbi:uncharacterized protein LOC144709445 isoform X2 [Wolffia australiana]
MASIIVNVSSKSSEIIQDSEITPLLEDHSRPPLEPDAIPIASPPPKQRLASLDVFRGLTVALMILVDDAGGAFPTINHAPWTGVTVADFVMPFFLFVVGVSVALVFKRAPDRTVATKKVVKRSIKLFLLGLLLQGGFFHGRNNLTFGVDIERIRLLGVLQRISIGYFLAGMMEIWLINEVVVDSPLAYTKRYFSEWIVAILLCSVYMGLIYGLYIPDWTFEVSQRIFAEQSHLYQSEFVSCEVRGSLEPPCNAVGLVDRFFLGEKHLYQRPVYRRTKECSINAPDYGPLPSNAPNWCLAPFDPEGILSSLTAAVTCFIGLHYGHVIVNIKGHMKILISWLISSMLLLILGFFLRILGVPLSKPLYTLSYLCVSAGVAGIVLTVLYYIVDVQKMKKATILLEWMGLNALIVYALAACELFPAAIQGFYWGSSENNLVNLSESWLQAAVQSKKWGTLAFVILEIIFWCLVAGFLHKRAYFFLIEGNDGRLAGTHKK